MFYGILTSVGGRRGKLLYHLAAKQPLIILVHTVHQVTGVAPQRRWLCVVRESSENLQTKSLPRNFFTNVFLKVSTNMY